MLQTNSKPVLKFKILDRASLSLVKYLCLLQIHDEDEAKNIQPWIVCQQYQECHTCYVCINAKTVLDNYLQTSLML